MESLAFFEQKLITLSFEAAQFCFASSARPKNSRWDLRNLFFTSSHLDVIEVSCRETSLRELSDLPGSAVLFDAMVDSNAATFIVKSHKAISERFWSVTFWDATLDSSASSFDVKLAMVLSEAACFS